MAYAHPPQQNGRGQNDPLRRDEGRPNWDPPPYLPGPSYNAPTGMVRSSYHVMDPEQSDSDVSVGGNDTYILGNPAEPAPPGPAKQLLESVEAIHARLGELSHVDDSNVRKQRALADKRRRQDDRIRQRREAQDRVIKAIYDGRERHDARISKRRIAEDARFKAIEQQIEEEEHSLHRRLKRLKRGLPVEESPNEAAKSISSSSMSPTGPPFSTVPPPAKRHQTAPPSHNDSGHPAPHNTLPPPHSNHSTAPSYSFYQGSQQPAALPYHQSSTYSTVPPSGPVQPVQPTALHNNHQVSSDRPSYAPNGKPSPPLSRAPPIGNTFQYESQPSQPRQTSSSYDTRPPPPTSGFAPVNGPTTSGFAAVNARAAANGPAVVATPPSAYSNIARPVVENQTPNAAFPDAQNESQHYGSHGNGSNSSTSTPAGGAGGKRTPSTTHPYQMSEAFANRHHHCERVDSLQRGVWTYYGPNFGTREHPTGPPQEMYLRCNHDGCRRIDWRTVHGLQCHIVKNHDQPKGTIGSLEKALDKYGVPVAEIEEYEKEHGEGTGGTMADPKNLKIKNKLREVARRTAFGPPPGSWGLDPTARPAGYKPSPGPDNSMGRMTIEKDMGDFVAQRSAGYVEDVNAFSAADSQTPGSEVKSSRYGAGRAEWASATPSRVPLPTDSNRQLQGDAVMQDRESPAPAKGNESGPEIRQWATTNFRQYAPPTATPPPRPIPVQTPPPKPSSATPKTVETGLSSSSNARDQPSQLLQEENKSSQAGEESVAPAPFRDPASQDISKSDAVAEVPAEESQSPKQAVAVPKPDDTSVVADNQVLGSGTDEVSSAKVNEGPADAKENKEEQKDAEFKEPPTPVDGPARGTRSALQSPVISQKPLNTPTSTKRSSRRASTAHRQSIDAGTDGHPPAPSSHGDEIDVERTGSARGTDDGEGQDGENLTATSAKRQKDDDSKETDATRTPARRNASGRFTRRQARG